MRNNEISFDEIIRILYRKKWIIILTFLLILIGVYFYNNIKPPLYQSKVLLKKEAQIFDNKDDRLTNILAVSTPDELETEMQLAQTRKVIDDAILELSLNVMIDKIVLPDGTVTIINLPLIDYQNSKKSNNYNTNFPDVNKLNVGLKTEKHTFIIKSSENENFGIYNEQGINVNNSEKSYSELKTQNWNWDINWPEINDKCEIYFSTLNYNDVFDELHNNSNTERIIKTNIFEISVKSRTPFSAKEIANNLANKFKENRITLQKENIRSSFTFLDERLKEVAENLEIAQNELTNYKSREKLSQIDEQSKSLVGFISNLESEKLKTDLDLILYNSRYNNIKKEVQQAGYVDQTFLTPEQYQAYDSPFSSLLRELSNLEIQKLELLQKRTDTHPDVMLLTEKIMKVKEQLTKFNYNTLTAFNIIKDALELKKSNLNSLIDSYLAKLEKLPEQENKLANLMRQKEVYEKMYTLLLDKREEMRVAELTKMQDIKILEYASEPIKPISPNKLLNLFFGGLFGILLGLALAFLSNFSDKRVKDIYEIEREFDFPILSVIPPFEKEIVKAISKSDSVSGKFVTMMEDKLSYREAYRTLETKLSAKIKSEPKIVLITSCEEEAGKSTTSANLAITIAQSGKKVLLIDCDIKKPKLADLFGLPKYSSGLLDYLTEKTDTPNIYKPIKLTKNANLLMNIDLIPTGVFSNISGEVLASERMKRLLSNLDYYDFVILDTPPITRVSDALSLSRIVKDTVLVIRPGQTFKESISWAINELKTTGINFLGVLVNDCKIKSGSHKYEYGYSVKK